MVEGDIVTDYETRFLSLYNKYKNATTSEDSKKRIRDQLLNFIPYLPYPEMAVDLAAEFGPEAVYSRLNQLYKDQLSKQGYSEFENLVSTYQRLEAISELNKGIKPKQGDGQVNLFNGQFVHNDTDLYIKGVGLNFKLERIYKSQVVYSGPLGANWDHSYNLWLRVEEGGSRVIRSTGRLREDTYDWDEDNNVYILPNGFFDKLTKEIVSLPNRGNIESRYVLETVNGTKYIYIEIPNSNGLYKVEYIMDRFSNTISFKYDDNNNGLLETIIDTLGKKIQFLYDDEGRIIEIRDNDRSIFYCYNNNNELVCVKKPQPELGKEASIIQYEYSSYDNSKEFIHNIVAIIDAEGKRYLENEYGTVKGHLNFNRIVRQRNAESEFLYEYIDIYLLESEEENVNIPRYKTVVTKRNNQIVEYLLNSQGNLIKTSECIGEPAKLNVSVSVEYKYNKDGNMIWMNDAMGNTTCFVYYRDWYGLNGGNIASLDERRKFGNLLKVIKQCKNSNTNLLTSPPFIDSNDIVLEFEYNNFYNEITEKTDPRNKNWKTKFIYSTNPNGQITDEKDGIYLRKILYPEVTLPDGHKQQLIKEFEYNEHGQTKAEKAFRQTIVQNRNIVILNQPMEIVKKYYYFGESYTDEVIVEDDISKTGYLYMVKYDVGEDISSRRFANIKVTFDVDRVGNIVKITDGRGNTSKYKYDKLDRQIEEILPLHEISQRKFYDLNSRIIRIEEDLKDCVGNYYKPDSVLILEREYDSMDNLIKEELGVNSSFGKHITMYRYTPSDMLCKTTDVNGNVIRYRHNERDFVKSETYGFGTLDESTIKYTYDYDGLVIKIENGEGHIVKIDYDEFCRIKSLTDDLGNKDIYEYNKLGNVVKRSFIDYKGNLLTQTEHDYDEQGRLTERKDFWFNLGEEAKASYVRSHFYFDEDDNLIRLVKDVDNFEQITDFEYDALGRQIRLVDNLGNEIVNEYDANNNLIKVIENEKKSEGTDQEIFVTLYEYDELNRLVRITDNSGNINRLWYNSQNKLVQREDPLGNIVSYKYDIFGRKVLENNKMNDGEEIITKYYYDNKGLLTKIEDNKGNPTLFKYDSLDRQIEIEYADGTVTKSIYDKNSNLIQETDCNGLIKKYTYDELDRLKQINIDKSNITTGIDILGSLYENFDYDGLGRIVKATNQNSIVEFEFDSLGNLIKDVQNNRVVKSEYNSSRLRDKLIYPNGRKLSIISDELNRIKRIENIDLGDDYPGESNDSTIILNNSFIGPYRLYERQFGNGVKSTCSYDANKRNISIQYSKDEKLLFEIQSLYDDNGNKRFENMLKNLSNEGVFYSYDSLYRLIGVRKGVTIPAFNTADFKPIESIASISSYNASTQMKINNFIKLINWNDENKIEFNYDSLGNRVNNKETGKPDITYKANNVNEYISIDNMNLIYDKNGNLINDGTYKYYYDYNNRLVTVKDIQDNFIASYIYDATGRRIEKITNKEKVAFIYDGNNVVEERDDNETVVAQYVFSNDIDDIIQMVRKNNKDCYYLKNSLGNIIALSGIKQDIIEEYTYSPFGIVNSPSKVENPYLFTSRRLDEETMLMYYRARYYSPQLGRFIQRDPTGYKNNKNLYEYVGNNPINRVDPMGLQEESGEENMDFENDPGDGCIYDYDENKWGDPVYRSDSDPVELSSPRTETSVGGVGEVKDFRDQYEVKTAWDDLPEDARMKIDKNYFNSLTIEKRNAFYDVYMALRSQQLWEHVTRVVQVFPNNTRGARFTYKTGTTSASSFDEGFKGKLSSNPNFCRDLKDEWRQVVTPGTSGLHIKTYNSKLKLLEAHIDRIQVVQGGTSNFECIYATPYWLGHIIRDYTGVKVFPEMKMSISPVKTLEIEFIYRF